MSNQDATIFALSTAPGRAGVAIIRISGSSALSVGKEIGIKRTLTPRMATNITLSHPTTGETIDHALVLYFAAPASFTGEDVIELHIHGGRAVIEETLTILSTIKNCRLAEAGEFTRRAFVNGKMDLTEVEGLADLINAETQTQKHIALRQMQGELGSLYQGWRSSVIHALAHIEAYIDFPDEDIPDDTSKSINDSINVIINAIDTHLSDNHRGEKIREGIHIAIIGPPNAGKSSLLNALAKRDVAIVSDIAGTTRDTIEVTLDIAGIPVTFIDTAGIRTTDNKIEIEGIERARSKAASADMTLVIYDINDWPNVTPEIEALKNDEHMTLLNKAESYRLDTLELSASTLPISVKSGLNINKLLNDIETSIKRQYSPTSSPMLTRIRHRNHLLVARDMLSSFSLDKPIELACEDLRRGAQAIGMITGSISVEEILDKVFGDFCIGK